MQQVDTRVRYMVRVAMLSAVSIILWMPIFEIPMFLPWLKLDFSTMPALLAGFAMGPVQGLIVLLIKALVHIPMGTTAGIGELADFLCSAALVAVSYTHLHPMPGDGASGGQALASVRCTIPRVQRVAFRQTCQRTARSIPCVNA